MPLVLAAMLAACGSGTKSPTTASAPKAAPTTTNAPPAAPALTKAEAVAFAKAVNLRPSDLPGYKPSAESGHESAAEKEEGRAFLSCVGKAAKSHALYEAGSPTFGREANTAVESVRSEVEVATSPAAAAAQLTAARSPKVRDCLAGLVTRAFKSAVSSGGAIGPVSVVSLTPSAPATEGGFEWKISATFSLHGIKVPLQLNFIGFSYRAATVVLFDYGFPEPLPSGQEARLFSLLVHRATTFSG